MPPFDLKPLSGRYLSFREREAIALMKAQGAGVRHMARELGRDPSTISRELRRNAATPGGKLATARRSPVEGGDRRSTPEDSETGREPATTRLCAGTAVRSRQSA
jgi:IS30 family transposase